MTCGIYAIRRKIDGRCYIGSSHKVETRWKQHLAMLESRRHHSPHLQHSWDAYGAQAHEFVLLGTCRSEQLVAFEQKHLDVASSVFNAAPIAGSRLGSRQRPDAVLRTSAANTGQKRTDATKARMSAWQKGQPKPTSNGRRSAEFCSAMSKLMKGKQKSDAHRAALSISARGRRHSELSRHRMSQSRMGHETSIETRAKMSAAMIGNTRNAGHRKTPAQIEAMRRIHIGRKRSPETRARISARAKKRACFAEKPAVIQSIGRCL